MDEELVRLRVERRRRFQSSDERTVSELCLSISSDDLATFTQWQPVSLLLRRALKSDRRNKHAKVKSKRGTVENCVPVCVERKDVFTFVLHLELEHEPTPSQSAAVHFRTIYFTIGCREFAVVVLSELLMQFRCKLLDQFMATVMGCQH
jgi:hypothetical protein